MQIHTLILGQMGNCCYIIGNGGKAIIIDPSWDMRAIDEFTAERELETAAVIFTHGHYDHLDGAAELIKNYKLKAYIEESDIALSRLPPGILQPFKGDYAVDIAGLRVQFLHTPGHTPGSCCMLIGGDLFTGDTLFPGACGRTDFPGGDPRQMHASLARLAALPPATKIHAGHAMSGQDGSNRSTIADELKCNPYIKMALKVTRRNENK